MENEKRLVELEKKLERLEAELLEQEHRPFRLVWNFWNRKTIWKNPDDHRRVATKKALLWRLLFSPTTIALGSGGLIAILTLYFLYQQNLLFQNQNDLFETQNERIDQQTKLLEASRRSTQVFLMSEVLSDLNAETRSWTKDKGLLSQGLVGRIIALSRSMKPYYFLEDSSFIKRKVSPERGQLLIALLSIDMDENQLFEVFENGDFSYAELNNIVVKNKSLKGINLKHAQARNSIFINTDLSVRAMQYADFSNAHFEGCKFTGIRAALDNTNFSGAYFSYVELRMGEVGLRYADFSGVTLDESIIYGQLWHTDFSEAKFFDVRSEYLSFLDCDLSKVSLHFLEDTTNLKADFAGDCILDSARVSREDWFSHMKEKINPYSIEWMENKYSIEISRGSGGWYEYLLKRRVSQSPST